MVAGSSKGAEPEDRSGKLGTTTTGTGCNCPAAAAATKRQPAARERLTASGTGTAAKEMAIGRPWLQAPEQPVHRDTPRGSSKGGGRVKREG